MTEIFFVLTVIFVAYVYCSIVNGKKTVAPTPTITEPEKPTPIAIPIKQEAVKTTPAKVAKIIVPVKKGLKNPSTGEIATSYANYRFTKRWIKDALVSEGLLTKVYKNNELDAESEALIRSAIAELETMETYKVG